MYFYIRCENKIGYMGNKKYNNIIPSPQNKIRLFYGVSTLFNVEIWFICNNYIFNVLSNFFCWITLFIRPYLPTAPLGQDITQGQFLSGV